MEFIEIVSGVSIVIYISILYYCNKCYFGNIFSFKVRIIINEII